MTNTSVIYDASIRDLDTICEIERECFSQEAFPRWYYVSLLLSPDVVFLESCIQKTIAGFIVGLIRQIEDDMNCTIATVNVRKEFRRKGTATALVRALEDRLIERRCSQVVLQVNIDNTASIRLFTKLHYQRLSILKDYYGSGRDAFRMGKTFDCDDTPASCINRSSNEDALRSRPS